ncbi:energy-coupling factor ABC transporter ATP-binding protein [Adlercreutzia murintestinalis]|uniref:energy-coupling factor ABC transporter ATP-binding protein n=1 Tax=Adlercreutzia murintestinalis TaxID=2941325 RepID=UPI0020424637|nr:ATP-binding cassette domain-containing protein [Adlercreutzia murintestinalis]
MLCLKDFSFKYAESDRFALRDINLAVPDGCFVGITGAAGSGKSTLTYAMNGIIPHCYPGDFFGSVIVGSLDTVDASLTDISRLVGSVCQDIDSQMVASIVEDEVLYGLENFGVRTDEVEVRLTDALEAMGIADLRTRTIDSLSGGQKQKVALASIIALRPKVLLLDEPTAELDPASSLAVFELLREYAHHHQTTVIVVEQKIALLADFADKLVIVEKGRIRFDGAPADVLAHSEELLEIGVNVPRATSLVNGLRQRGLYRGSAVRDVDEAVAVCEEVLA